MKLKEAGVRKFAGFFAVLTPLIVKLFQTCDPAIVSTLVWGIIAALTVFIGGNAIEHVMQPKNEIKQEDGHV